MGIKVKPELSRSQMLDDDYLLRELMNVKDGPFERC
jgi:hypothetical protein